MTNNDLNTLVDFLNNHVRPMYFSLDRGHDEYHYDEVLKTAIKLSYFYNISDIDLISLIVASAYHDTGRIVADKGHEDISVKIFKRDLHLKEFLEETFPKIKYKNILRKGIKIIKNHGSSNKTKDELSLILQDADKISHLNKERFISRSVGYYLDRRYTNESKTEIVSNKILSIGGSITFTPKSKAMKYILGKENTININITSSDIELVVNKLFN